MASKEVIEWCMLGCSNNQKKYFEQVLKDLERLEKQDKLLHIFKNNMELVDYKGNGSTQAYKIIIEDKFTVEEDGEYVTCHNSDFDDIKEWSDGK